MSDLVLKVNGLHFMETDYSEFIPEPKRRWWAFITDRAFILLYRFFKRSEHWSLVPDDVDPGAFWKWRLKRDWLHFCHVLFPIIRAVYPTAIAEAIVSVQPMDHVSGVSIVKLGEVMDIMESKGYRF